MTYEPDSDCFFVFSSNIPALFDVSQVYPRSEVFEGPSLETDNHSIVSARNEYEARPRFLGEDFFFFPRILGGSDKEFLKIFTFFDDTSKSLGRV